MTPAWILLLQWNLINGSQHCLGDYGTTVNVVSFWDWVKSMVNDEPGWEDVLE